MTARATPVATDPNEEGVSQIVERFVDLGDVRLNVASAGSGRPVVLLHGFPDSWRLWRHQIRVLADAGFRVIAPDLRGFGRSSRPLDVANYRMSVLAGDVAGLLDSMGVDRAAVVGHDWGAVLAWWFAGSMPQRVERLVAVSVGHPAAGATSGAIDPQQRSGYLRWFLPPGVAERILPRDDWRLFRDWGWHGAEPDTDPDCARQIADLSRPGALTAGLNWYRANLGSAAPDQPVRALVPISCPTMGVWSTGDQFLAEGQMTRSEDFVTRSWRYERLTCDHWVPVHAADELGHLLLDFLG